MTLCYYQLILLFWDHYGYLHRLLIIPITYYIEMENVMRKIIKLLTMIMLAAIVMGGCGTKEEIPDAPDTSTSDQSPTGNGEELYSFRAEIIEVGDTLLIAPSEDSNEAKSSDKIAVSYGDATLVDESGTTIKSEELLVGDILEISYDGVILESYPAQITARKIVKITAAN